MVREFDKAIGVFAAVLVLASPLATAQDAANGADYAQTSDTGVVDVTLVIPPRLRVATIRDMSLGGITRQSPAGQDVCVFSNPDQIAVTALGRNAGSTFVARNGNRSVGYAVSFGGAPLVPGQSTRLALDTARPDATCAGGTGLKLEVTTQGTTGTRPGSDNTYSDVLTLVFAAT